MLALAPTTGSPSLFGGEPVQAAIARGSLKRVRESLVARIAEALQAARGPTSGGWSRGAPTAKALAAMGPALPLHPTTTLTHPAQALDADVDALLVRLFEQEGRSLVRLVRLFVDDRNAAEDLVQEGFIRLARSAHRIRDDAKAVAYLRSIVLNLARDHNRRGLVSLRHHLPMDPARASTEDEIVLLQEQQRVIDVLRELPHRQRDCLVLRYYEQLGIDQIAGTLEISPNSVKTHLKRALLNMGQRLGVPVDDTDAAGADE